MSERLKLDSLEEDPVPSVLNSSSSNKIELRINSAWENSPNIEEVKINSILSTKILPMSEYILPESLFPSETEIKDNISEYREIREKNVDINFSKKSNANAAEKLRRNRRKSRRDHPSTSHYHAQPSHIHPNHLTGAPIKEVSRNEIYTNLREQSGHRSKKGEWTHYEHQMLLNLYNKFELFSQKWVRIGACHPTRDKEQCKSHFQKFKNNIGMFNERRKIHLNERGIMSDEEFVLVLNNLIDNRSKGIMMENNNNNNNNNNSDSDSDIKIPIENNRYEEITTLNTTKTERRMNIKRNINRKRNVNINNLRKSSSGNKLRSHNKNKNIIIGKRDKTLEDYQMENPIYRRMEVGRSEEKKSEFTRVLNFMIDQTLSQEIPAVINIPYSSRESQASGLTNRYTHTYSSPDNNNREVLLPKTSISHCDPGVFASPQPKINYSNPKELHYVERETFTSILASSNTS